jgi:hypothetical protein
VGDFAQLDDDELLRLSREQPDAFGAFYERHVRAVLAHVRRQGLGMEEALDLTGEIFAAALMATPRYADADVESIRVLGEAAGAEVRMTKPWTPRTEGGQALRLFVVIDERDIDVGGDGLQEDELGLISTPTPAIEVTYADGRTETIEAP